MRAQRTLGAAVLGLVLGLTGLIMFVQPSPAAGSGGDEVVLVEPSGKWHVQVPGQADYTFWYGVPGDIPLLGDWNGDGIDTPGAWRQGPGGGYAYLTNSLPAEDQVGVADFDFYFGGPGDEVFVGDWNGDGTDTLGISRSGHVFLTNTNGSRGAPVPTHHDFWFGTPGDRPFGGDGNGDGMDSVFLYRPSGPGAGYVYYTNQTPAVGGSVANTAAFFFFGVASDRFVAGDWNADEIDTAGIFRPVNNTVYLSNTNPSGGAPAPTDVSYAWGHPAWTPVAGWTGVNTPVTTTTTTTLPQPISLPIRVNAGGPEIPSSDGHPWQQDTAANPSPFVNSNSGDPHNTTTAWPTPSIDNSVPAGTPPGIFATERYDEAGGPNMHWNLPVDPDQWVEVRLYFASGYPGARDIAERLFDVTIDDWLVLDDYDIVADVGHQVGVMKRFVVKTDADGLDILFSHLSPAVENPLVNAIEIVQPERLWVVRAPSDPVSGGANLLNVLAQVATKPKGPGNQWTVKIMPGVYQPSAPLLMEPYVEIEGSGSDQTRIQVTVDPANFSLGAAVVAADNSGIRHLGIEVADGGWTGQSYGILSLDRSPDIESVAIDLQSTALTGIRVEGGSPQIRDVGVTSAGYTSSTMTGISLTDSSPRIANLDLAVNSVMSGHAVALSASRSIFDLSHSNLVGTNLAWGSTGVSVFESEVRAKDLYVEATGGYHPATAIRTVASTVTLENVTATVDVNGGPMTAARFTDSVVTIDGFSLTATDGDPPFLMTITGSDVTMTDAYLSSFEDTFSTGRGITLEDGALPLAVLIDGSTVHAPDWIMTNNSTGTVSLTNSILDGGPMLGTGPVVCTSVWDEHGTFYANTCPN